MLLHVALPDEPPERVLVVPSNPQTIGDEWLLSGRTAVLRVPSIIVPQATNLLLNPKHSLAASANIISAEPFKFDPRLWRNAPPGVPAP
jgi:RES domain-containing protein